MSQPEIFGASLVAVGSFNPPIVSIDWLLEHNLIGAGDAEAARSSDIFVAAREISRFQTDALMVQVVESQLSISATSAVTPALADLFCGIFELLPHTPISAVGLNFWAHYRLDAKAYHQVGDVYAPKSIWNEIFPDRAIGLSDLTFIVQDGTREKTQNSLNHTRITLQPSQKLPSGVFFQFNGHHGSDQGEPLKVGRAASALVRQNWEASYTEALRIFEAALNGALR